MKIKINYLRENVRCANSREIVKFTTDKGLWKESYREKAWLLLRNHNNVRGLYLLSAGGIDCTPIDVRLACKAALDALADNVILLHNHPSGRPTGCATRSPCSTSASPTISSSATGTFTPSPRRRRRK